MQLKRVRILRLPARSRIATVLVAMIAILAFPTPARATTGPLIAAVGVADWDGDGHQDIVAYDLDTYALWLYAGESKRGYSSQWRVQIGEGWNHYTIAGVVDWDNDGHQDIVARENATGALWMYPGESKRGYSSQPRVQIGNGWNNYRVVGLGDWDGDGHADIVAYDFHTEALWLYPGESKRGYSSHWRVQIGEGWNGYVVEGIADWDHDGHQDLVAVDLTGQLWLYPGESKRGYSSQPRVQIGEGWTAY